MSGESQGDTTLVFVVPGTNITMTGTSVYTTGTISSIGFGVNVVGSGTTWTAAMIGQKIFISNRWYTIANVTDTTHLTLASGYADGTTYSGVYRISSTIHDVDIRNMTITGSTVTALVCTDIQNLVMVDVMFAANNKGFSLTNGTNTDINRVVVVSNTSNGYEITNNSFFNAQDFAVISNGGHGGVWNNVKLSRVIYSAGDANTTDGYNCTDVTNSVFQLECAGNGGQGLEFVSGCNYNMINYYYNGNGSDGIKLTATSSGNNISMANIQGNGGYGINIAAASCVSNIVVAAFYAGNSSGTINDSGTTTKIV